MGSKKMRMTEEEKQTLADCCKALDTIPRTDYLGNPIFAKTKCKGQYMIDNYEAITASGIKIHDKKHLIRPDGNYFIQEPQIINTYDRMVKALKAGRLVEEIKKHDAESERFRKRMLEISTEREKNQAEAVEESQQH